MKRRRRTRTALIALTACVVGTGVGLPLLAAAGGFISPEGCVPGQLATLGTGSPTIIGPSTLTDVDLVLWWESTGRAHPPRLSISIDDVIGLYLAEGDAEGVRGDLAFAQAVHESGYFGSSDTSRNNFAGIGHPDGASSGQDFPDPTVGVRAHVQLLKKYADGNDADLAHSNVAPEAAGQATTWEELAGTWASDDNYWTALSELYTTMLDEAGRQPDNTPPGEPDTCLPSPEPGAIGGTSQVGDVTVTTVSCPTGGTITVAASIGPQVQQLLDAAAADGTPMCGWGYRSTNEQIALRRQNCGTSRYATYDMPSSQCQPPTARPGSSQHELGLAIDFTQHGNTLDCGDSGYMWLTGNASTYSLYNLPSECWHWSTTGD